MLTPNVPATREAVHAISEADLIIIGPGSFYTSLMPILLLKEIAQALRRTPAPMVYIGNLGRELSLPAANLKLESKLAIMEQYVGKKVIDAVIVGPKVDVSAVKERIVIQEVLEASDIRIVMTASCCIARWKGITGFRLTRSRKNIPASSSCHDAAINSSRN